MDYHRQKSQPGAQSPLVKSMVHLANFSAKQLRKEDYNNLYKDFDTLLKIDDINDLDLSDFNGWDIDLAKYQQALDHEFSGEFDDALKLYQECGISNDVTRVKNLQKELSKDLRDGEKYMTLVNIQQLLSEYEQRTH